MLITITGNLPKCYVVFKELLSRFFSRTAARINIFMTTVLHHYFGDSNTLLNNISIHTIKTI